MGVGLRATLVAGYEIPRQLVLRENTKRKCKHPEVPEANFCPVCGKPMWETTVEPIFDDCDEVGRFEVVQRGCRDDHDSLYYIGAQRERRLTPVELRESQLAKLRVELDTELKKLGIDPGACTFGVHMVAELSY
jgi:hypothetical protein